MSRSIHAELDIDTLPKDFALLVNARIDKGFDHMVRVAALCPAIPFVAIASQSAAETAQSIVARAALTNVTIIGHTSRIDDLYRRARVVLVPSYKFLETFSRVCIEAQRHGKPVIGSDRGNVPLLLRESGTPLPEHPETWANAINVLYQDEKAYAKASQLSLINSRQYSKQAQTAAFDRMVAAVRSPLLIGIGSGIGNMLHAGPMIRNIARRTGAPVDLVVSEDHSESLFLLQDPRHVNAVHSIGSAVLDRHYDTVFLTHCFGDTQLSFSCDRLLRSRDWEKFEPGRSAHETIFNLEAAKVLLGIDYDENDITTHYVSEISYEWSDGPVVGFHGGSKPRYWSAKRWPGFPELAAQLKARGFRVVCFGSPEEAIEGAEDRTGGTIEEMTRDMRMCSWFVSNDSGVMNIANALGIPVLSIFAPTDTNTRRPLAPRNLAVSVTKSCSPCEVKNREAFKAGHCNCIAEISVADVLAAFDQMRAKLSASKEPYLTGELK